MRVLRFCWLAICMTVSLATAALPGESTADHLLDFQIKDQFQQIHTSREFSGAISIFVWVDRSSRDLSAAWVVALANALADRAPQKTWQVRMVAHTKGAPFFVKGRIRNSFSSDPARWALLDWHGVFQKTYQPPRNQVTVLAFRSDGQLAARYSGMGVDQAVIDELVKQASLGGQIELPRARLPVQDDFYARLVAAAMERLSHRVTYDGSYQRLAYPGGDVPDSVGVCADVVIRVYHSVGIDLQRALHEDMLQDFNAYPKNWGLSRPDANIDHRRVPNLRVFFARHGQSLPVTEDPQDFQPGDLVTWMLPGNLPHIGIVVKQRSAGGQHPLVVHNIGRGPELDDILFKFPMTGHYRYNGSR